MIFLFLDSNNNCVIFYSCDGKLITRTYLSLKPFDFVNIGNNKVAVSHYLDNVVCMVDLNQRYEVNKISTIAQCYGIDYADEKVFVALPHLNKIQILDLTKENDIERTPYSAYYLTFSSGHLYCSNYIANILFCLSTSGKLVWEYEHNNIREPCATALGPNGYLYVACRQSKSVHSISSDGSEGKVLLRNVREITIPRALDMCSTTKTFILCNEQSGNTILYKFDNV